MRRELLAMQAALDSMQRQMSAQEQYFASKAVALNDELAKNETASKYKKGFNKDSAQSNKIPYSVGNIKPVGDTLKQILQEASSGGGKLTDLRLSYLSGATESGNMNFGSPLTSTAIMNNPFEPGKGHYGIDIADKEGTPIKAVLGGTVILSTWSYESGFMIAVQHHNNFVSFYKHCSMLLKKVGDYVNAGEVLAIIGNTGTHSSGPHLHFELWHNAHPIDPKLYIKF
jgi:murein DD-endopeptidase MepM/ murein hydrolase activator NlpD